MLLRATRRTDLALEELQKTREMDPNFAHVHWQLGLVYLWKGELQRAAAEFQSASTLGPSVTMYKGLGHVYARAGRTAEAHRLLEELVVLSKQRYVSRMDFASIYAGLGEKDRAFECLETAYKQHDLGLSCGLDAAQSMTACAPTRVCKSCCAVSGYRAHDGQSGEERLLLVCRLFAKCTGRMGRCVAFSLSNLTSGARITAIHPKR
jgi:tetratricopeptide (TPR) repeat protein